MDGRGCMNDGELECIADVMDETGCMNDGRLECMLDVKVE